MAWPGVYGLDSGDFERDADKRVRRPTIVLVHDAFHSPTHLERLAGELRKAGFVGLIPPLASSTSTHIPDIFEVDVQTLCASSKAEMDSGRDVIFVLHGYAGTVGPVAAERLNRYALGRPGAGFVTKIIFVAAIVANEDECFFDILRPEWLVHENSVLRVHKPDQVFFRDCSSEDRRAALSMIRPQLLDSFRFKIKSPGWSRIPCAYIICENDRAIISRLQQACVRKLRARNQQVAIANLQSGHSPFLSHTQEISTLIIQCSSSGT